MSGEIRHVRVGSVERRPGRNGEPVVAFPAEWGEPPSLETRALAAWVKVKILDGKIAQARGESVPWLEGIESR